MQLKDLLEILAQTDADLCQAFTQTDATGLPFLIRVAKRWIPLSPWTGFEGEPDGLVDYALRERIRERRWFYHVISQQGGAIAVVQPYPQPAGAPVEGETDAIAITTAYLQACGHQIDQTD